MCSRTSATQRPAAAETPEQHLLTVRCHESHVQTFGGPQQPRPTSRRDLPDLVALRGPRDDHGFIAGRAMIPHIGGLERRVDRAADEVESVQHRLRALRLEPTHDPGVRIETNCPNRGWGEELAE